MFEEISKHQQVFSSMLTWDAGGMNNFEVNGVKFAAGLDAVNGDYFSTLGIRPLLGRLIAPGDVGLRTGSSTQVAVLDYRCWKSRYNGDLNVVGKTIRINGIPLTIIGVTPKNFSGLILDGVPDATVPIGYSGGKNFHDPKMLWLNVIGRLRPDVTLPQARAQMKTLWPAVQAAILPEGYEGAQRARFFARRIDVESAARGTSYLLREQVSRKLAVLMGLAGLVLLIACVNLANIMLARVAGRRQELGIRAALGASSWRLIRQLLTESVMLSAIGAALGFGAAFRTSRLLLNAMWFYVPAALDPAPDLRVLAFTATIAVLTGIVFGLAPAWGVTRTDPTSALQHNTRTVRGGCGTPSKRLVSVQVAFALVLVIGAALFVRSLQKLRSVDPGFRRAGVLVMQLFPQAGREQIPNRTEYYRQVAKRLSELPGVESVSYSHMGPVMPYEYKIPVSIPGSAAAPAEAAEDWVGPGFFHLIGMRLLAGREFDWRDNERATRVAIVSQSLARRLFPVQNPIGRRIAITGQPNRTGMEIVGMVNSASLWMVKSHEPMAVYFPLMQEPTQNQSRIDIRTAGNPLAVAPSARRVLESMGHHYPLSIQTLEERADLFLLQERLIAILSVFFGGLALLLASVGLYGLMSYTMTRRTSEIGIRMALGAQPNDLLSRILREVMWLSLAGIAVGVPAALAASRLVSGMLFGVSANDPATIALSAAILLGVSIFAGYLPARRAVRIDPMIALRSE